jgi:hypothetical protein
MGGETKVEMTKSTVASHQNINSTIAQCTGGRVMYTSLLSNEDLSLPTTIVSM